MANIDAKTEQSAIDVPPHGALSDQEWQQQMFHHNRAWFHGNDLATEWEGDTHIRLLRLEPGKFQDPVVGTLVTTWMDSAHRSPRYDAISYTWGRRASGDGFSITLNGLPGFEVTKNAFWVLRRVRHRHRPRDVWLDAICIDQTNLAEKSQQVSLMPRIYAEAESVICWFRPCGTSPDEEVEKCTDHVFRRQKESRRKDIVSKKAPLMYVTSDHSGEWWTRIWTASRAPTITRAKIMLADHEQVQECCVARKVEVLIGCHTHDYAVVEDTLSRRSSRNQNSLWPEELTEVGFFLEDRVDIMPNAPGHVANPGMQVHELKLLNCLRSTLDCNATDPRDRIFGVLGMCDTTCVPDYTKSLEEICVLAAADIFESEQSLNFVVSPEWNHFETQHCSWVPNFATRREDVVHLDRFEGVWCGDADQSLGQVYFHGSLLSVEAIRFDHISVVIEGDVDHDETLKVVSKYITQTTSPYADSIKAFERTREIARIYEISSDGLSQAGSDYEERSMSAASDTSEETRSADRRRSNESAEWLTDSTDSMPSVIEPSSDSHVSGEEDQQDEGNLSDQYCYLITSKGYFGIGYSPDVQVGDEVMLIARIDSPVALRPTDEGYRFFVDAYIHGLSDGEMEDRLVDPEVEFGFEKIILC